MPENISTLVILSVQVEAMLGLLLLYTWVQSAEIKAVGWWGCAHLLRATSIALFSMFGRLPDAITIDVADALLLMSFAVTWTGARLFGGRKINFVFLFEGAIIWLIACQMTGFVRSVELRALLSSGIIAAYTWFAAAELWRNTQGELVSRLPATFMLSAQGVLFLTDTPLGVLMPHIVRTEPAFRSIWLTILSSQELLFTIAIAYLLMAMAKERAGYLHNVSALLDPVTGIWNRHGFIAESKRMMQAMEQEVDNAAVLLIDLDNFDEINEGHGRLLGHRALEILAAIIKTVIRPSDVVGRLDGNEFVVVLFGGSRERAPTAAERIRSAFAEQAAIIAGHPVEATTSIGVLPYDGSSVVLRKLIWMADQALALAKERGRNQIELLEAESFV